MTAVLGAKTPRFIQRIALTDVAHFQAIDTDIDNLEAAIEIAAQSAAEQKASMRRLSQMAAGILVTLSTSSILLFLDLVVKK
jgi:hypothetical protein